MIKRSETRRPVIADRSNVIYGPHWPRHLYGRTQPALANPSTVCCLAEIGRAIWHLKKVQFATLQQVVMLAEVIDHLV